jgi:DNA-binding IclR family transcriptional regulator
MRMVSAVGRRFPAYGTGVGKVLLAGLSDEAIAELYPSAEKMPSLTPHTISDPDELVAELRSTRRRGYATEIEESSVGLGCVAAPIYDPDYLVAAMSISVPTARFPQHGCDDLVARVRAAGRELSSRLGATTYPEHITPGATRGL